jgi:hypothetical protein
MKTRTQGDASRIDADRGKLIVDLIRPQWRAKSVPMISA